jgi:hypothetical protein
VGAWTECPLSAGMSTAHLSRRFQAPVEAPSTGPNECPMEGPLKGTLRRRPWSCSGASRGTDAVAFRRAQSRSPGSAYAPKRLCDFR